MADNAADFVRAVAMEVERHTGMPVEFVDDIPWRERERRLYAGEIEVCWICGLPYVMESRRLRPRVEVLAAPVMSAPRYGGRAVYFSDLIVRADRQANGWSDLHRSRIAYNEPNSHSGYTMLCHALARMQARAGFFAEVIESGAHQRSLEMVLAGSVDAAVIDSTVLETELEVRPVLSNRLRVIETLGPSPMPPWVVHRAVPDRIKADLQHALVNMNVSAPGRALLARARVARFEPVTDAWYDPMRTMMQQAASYPLRATHRVVAAAGGLALRRA